MAPRRAYWKGSLKLSLVSCPVALYPASTGVEKTRFHMINKETGNRLKQQMVDSETGDNLRKVTPWPPTPVRTPIPTVPPDHATRHWCASAEPPSLWV